MYMHTNHRQTFSFINTVVSTLVKQPGPGRKYKRESPFTGYRDNFSILHSSAFTGGTDMSIGQIQTKANDLANKMLPTLMRLMD